MSLAKSAVQTFGKYQILERIATGGMAEIYKARLEGIGGFQRTFAIKRILPHLSQNAEYVAMLVDEAKVAGLLSHANIVQILDLGQIDGVWYIAMEFVDGPDLGAVLRRCRQKNIQLPVPHTVFVAIELLKGLEYAHNRQVMRGGRTVPLNIIHRDVSPPNVLLSMQGEVKLTDFGIARASHKALETASGVVKGRFDYMSPEQAAGAKDLDQRSDLFSVGVVLYEMLTGAHPFRTDSEFATIDRIRTGQYEPASVVNPGVPFTLETIVDRALRVDRNERYPNATAFKDALDKFFHDAGFIFTHHSLASYVKGLFPDGGDDAGSRRTSNSFVPDEEVDDDLDLEFDDAGDGPTRVIGMGSMRDVRNKEQADPALFGLKTDDTATMVHKQDRWGEEEPETVVRKITDLSDETDTTSRGSLVDDVLDTQVPEDDPDPMAGPTELRRRPEEDPLDVSTEQPAPLRPITVPQSRPRPSGSPTWLAPLFAAVGFLAGLFLGTVVGVVVGQLISAGAVSTATPILQVETPPGVQVLVDGTLVSGSVNVTAGERHIVEVRVPGRPASRSSLVLQPGEHRMLVVSPVSPPGE